MDIGYCYLHSNSMDRVYCPMVNVDTNSTILASIFIVVNFVINSKLGEVKK